ncbi:MAG: HTH domain-containing protein, partial [Bacteroidetes bacterium]|nr:HTH domain-containing protein [Bacteroidota bacterium]
MSDLFSRLLRLVRLLQEPKGRTIAELAHLLQVNRRTIYRDLEKLESEGFPVEQKIENKRYFLVQPPVPSGLTSEETELITTALHALSQQDPVVQALCQKL